MNGSGNNKCPNYVCNLPFREEFEKHEYAISQNVMGYGVQTIVLTPQKNNPEILLQYIDVLGTPALRAVGYLLSGEDNALWDKDTHHKLVQEGDFSAELLHDPSITGQYRVYRTEGSYTLSLDDAAKILSTITGENIEDDEAVSAIEISTGSCMLVN